MQELELERASNKQKLADETARRSKEINETLTRSLTTYNRSKSDFVSKGIPKEEIEAFERQFLFPNANNNLELARVALHAVFSTKLAMQNAGDRKKIMDKMEQERAKEKKETPKPHEKPEKKDEKKSTMFDYFMRGSG